MSNISIIIQREFNERVRKKSFIITTLLMPVLMIGLMARIPYDIPLWEVALSLVVLYASFVGMVWFAAKIYRVGIFMYGKKPSLKELFKWIRYKY